MKALVKLIVFLFLGFCSLGMRFAQTKSNSTTSNTFTESPIPFFPFVRYELNRISHHENSTALHGTYQKLESLLFEGKGSLNIIHIGGSHVQAGTLPNRIKENLIAMGGNSRGDLGFFFPYKLASTNGPSHIKTSFTGKWEGCRCAVNSNQCDWGLSGYNASTSDSLVSVKIWATKPDSSLYQFNTFTIYHNAGQSGYCISLDSGLNVLYEESNLVAGYTTYQLLEKTDSIKFSAFRLEEGSGIFTLQGLSMGDLTKGITYNAIGVNGASVHSYLRCNAFQNQLQQNIPDLVIFGIGINDANAPNGDFIPEQFERNYDQLIKKFRDVNPDVEFLFITNNDSYYNRKKVNRNALLVREAMFRLAEKHHAAVWDFFSIMGGLDSIRAWEQSGLAKKDKVHLTVSGYLLKADLLSLAIKEDFGNFLENKYLSAGKVD